MKLTWYWWTAVIATPFIALGIAAFLYLIYLPRGAQQSRLERLYDIRHIRD